MEERCPYRYFDFVHGEGLHESHREALRQVLEGQDLDAGQEAHHHLLGCGLVAKGVGPGARDELWDPVLRHHLQPTRT